MLSNLLIYRLTIFNGFGIALAAWTWWSGLLAPIFEADHSRLTIAIAGLFIIGLVWVWREALSVSAALNTQKRLGVDPAPAATMDKDTAKIEWLGSVSEWLVGLGLLGTVIGFSMALSGVDQGSVSSASGAQSAVTTLIQGMRVALNTTLLGAALAMWHEANVRMLRTALTTYWSDRVAAWQEMY